MNGWIMQDVSAGGCSRSSPPWEFIEKLGYRWVLGIFPPGAWHDAPCLLTLGDFPNQLALALG